MERPKKVYGTLLNGQKVALKERQGPSLPNFDGIEFENLPATYLKYPLDITDVRGSADGASTVVLSKYIDRRSPKNGEVVGFEKHRVTETIGELSEAFLKAGQTVGIHRSFGVMVREVADRLLGRQPG